jgi:hypothetical protein
MSQGLGANVIGYDDEYAFKGWGNQYTAYPNGTVKLTQKGRVFKGSWADLDSWKAIWDGFVWAGNWGF